MKNDEIPLMLDLDEFLFCFISCCLLLIDNSCAQAPWPAGQSNRYIVPYYGQDLGFFCQSCISRRQGNQLIGDNEDLTANLTVLYTRRFLDFAEMIPWSEDQFCEHKVGGRILYGFDNPQKVEVAPGVWEPYNFDFYKNFTKRQRCAHHELCYELQANLNGVPFLIRGCAETYLYNTVTMSLRSSQDFERLKQLGCWKPYGDEVDIQECVCRGNMCNLQPLPRSKRLLRAPNVNSSLKLASIQQFVIAIAVVLVSVPRLK